MADLQDPKTIDWESFPIQFIDLRKAITIISIRAMLVRLQGLTEVNLPKELKFEDLELRALHAIESQLRDTLRTLGGAR